MTIFQSPTTIPSPFDVSFESVFIAGGISKCGPWQDEIIPLIDPRYDVFNPRRVGDFAKTGEDAEAQIAWEFKALDCVTAALFWFPKESVCPIALLDLGKMLEKARNGDIGTLLVGWDDDYERAFDLKIQTDLVLEASPVVGYENFKGEVSRLFGAPTKAAIE